MTSEVKFTTTEPWFFDLWGHRFPARFKRILACERRRLPRFIRTQLEKIMLDPQMLADRYVAVWNEKDEARRRDAIATLWVPDGRHFVGKRAVQGYEDLEKRVRGSHEKNVRDDGNRFRAAPGARRLRDIVTFYWEMHPSDADTALVRGMEFLIINNEDRILADYQFFPA
jgi:hypothetical protein